MKKLLVMIALGILSVTYGMAQEGTATRSPRTPEQRAEMQTKHLTKSLNLTADQQTQVKAIVLARAVQMDSLRANSTADKTQRMQQMKAAKEAGDADMQKVLSTEQYQKYVQMQEDRKDKIQQRRSRQGQ